MIKFLEDDKDKMSDDEIENKDDKDNSKEAGAKPPTARTRCEAARNQDKNT